MKNKFLTKWVISYLLILLIPFAVICMNYFYSTRMIGEEIYQSNELIVDNLGGDVDEYLKEIYNLYSNLYYADALKSLRSNNVKNNQFYRDALEMKNQLGTYITYSPQISAIIYLPELEYIFDLKTGNEAETYYSTYCMNAPNVGEYEDWVQRLSDNYQSELFVSEFFHSSTGGPCIVYANTLRSGRYQPANIFISIPVSAISELTEKVYEGSTFIMLVDDEIKTAWNSKGAVVADNKLQEAYTRAVKDGSESDYYLIKKTSDYEGKVSYCMLISKKAYEAKQVDIRNLFCISLVIALLVAFKVLHTLLKQRNEKSQLSERIQTQEELMQSNYLLMLMKGRKVEQYKEAVQIRKDQTLVLVGIMIPELEQKQKEQDDILLFAVDNIFSELVKENEYYKIDDGQYQFYLFVVEEPEESWRRECLKKAEHLNEIMNAWWKQGVYIAVSKPETGLEHISVQYNDIMEEFRDRRLLGEASVTDICRKHRMLSANERIVERIRELIDARYEDCDLNVTSIAEELGKTPKHISEVFKEETGEGLLYAINHKRITKAQALMKTGQYKLAEIPELTGYSNMNTFRRNFQQITGISPSKYMENKDE